MSLYNVQLSDTDLEFIIIAIKCHSQNLVEGIEHSRNKFHADAAKKYMDELTHRPSPVNPINAPHGLKKDGTASKRRGRPLKAKKVAA